MLELSDADCLLSSVLHRYFAYQALKGQLTLFVRSCILLHELWTVSGTNSVCLILRFQEASTEMLGSKRRALVLPARSPGVQGLAGGVVFATQSALHPRLFLQTQLEQCSVGALVRGLNIGYVSQLSC